MGMTNNDTHTQGGKEAAAAASKRELMNNDLAEDNLR